MKTVIISANSSWYLYNFRSSTILRLVKDGYKIVCISPKDKHTIKLENLGCEWFDLKMSNKGSNPFKDIRIVFRLFYLYVRFKPLAVYHFTIKNNIYGTWAAYLAGIPAINNISGLGTAFIRKGFISYIVKILYKLSQPLAYRVYCQNEEDYQLLIDERLIPQQKLFLLPGSGVDTIRFNPNLVSETGSVFRFLFVGRLIGDKGLYELMEAIKKINCDEPICHLWVCGFSKIDNISAISSKEIEEWQNLPGVVWIEPNDNIEQVMKDVNCIVLPSYREGMPKSLLEAGAMGLPSITTNVPGCRNIIQDKKNGLLCESRSSKSLELAMRTMISMPERDLIKMGHSARKIIEKSFDEEIVINAAIEALQSIKISTSKI